MIHPLVKLIAARPDLVAGHLGAYADLAALQAAEVALSLRRRAGLVAVASVGALMGVLLLGVATLLLAVVPLSAMPAPWLLAVVPALPLTVAATLWWQLRGLPWPAALPLLRGQIAADLALLREAGNL